MGLGARGSCLLENWTLLRVTKQTFVENSVQMDVCVENRWMCVWGGGRQSRQSTIPMSKWNHFSTFKRSFYCLILSYLDYSCDLEPDLKDSMLLITTGTLHGALL